MDHLCSILLPIYCRDVTLGKAVAVTTDQRTPDISRQETTLSNAGRRTSEEKYGGGRKGRGQERRRGVGSRRKHKSEKKATFYYAFSHVLQLN